MILFDTFTGSLRKLAKPRDKKPFQIYVCGPTVYDDMHLGHARTYLAFDVLVRFLRSLGWPVLYIQNITDIDDKIIDRARAAKTTPAALAEHFRRRYLADVKKLNINSVDEYIKASSVLTEIKDSISRLLAKDLAYTTPRGVYFRVRRFTRYGRLSGQNIDDLRSGYRIEPDPDKEDILDFALWKNQKHNYEPAWPSPWGPGRPGWHIECSSIIARAFGGSVDLHGGGQDLKFPHHEAEIAQVESACRHCQLAKIWLHTGFLLVNGAKMSKSEGNFITVTEFLSKYHPDVLRFIVLSRHYRSPLDWQASLLEQSVNSLLSLKSFLAWLSQARPAGSLRRDLNSLVKNFNRDFTAALSEDLNTPRALASLFTFMNSVQNLSSLNHREAALVLSVFNHVLGALGFSFSLESSLPVRISKLVSQREVLRILRDYTRADALRETIRAAGYLVDDTPSGPVVVRNNFVL